MAKTKKEKKEKKAGKRMKKKELVKALLDPVSYTHLSKPLNLLSSSTETIL